MKQLSEDDLRSWRDNPVTEALKAGLGRMLEVRREQISQAYWAGQPVPEAVRQALLELEGFREDLFESTLDDLRVWLDEEEEGK